MLTGETWPEKNTSFRAHGKHKVHFHPLEHIAQILAKDSSLA